MLPFNEAWLYACHCKLERRRCWPTGNHETRERKKERKKNQTGDKLLFEGGGDCTSREGKIDENEDDHWILVIFLYRLKDRLFEWIIMKRNVHFPIPPSLRTPTILSRVQQLSRLHCRLSSAHALEGERVKVCPPFTRGQVFETCNFFLLRSLYSLFFLLLLLFYTIVLYFIFSFLSNYVILFIYFKTIYKCRNTYRILQKIITKFLHTSPIQTVYI